jgi:hypothetical protein
MADPYKAARKAKGIFISHHGRESVNLADVRRRLAGAQGVGFEQPAPAAAPDLDDGSADGGDLNDILLASPHGMDVSSDSEAEDAPAPGEVTDDEAEGGL